MDQMMDRLVDRDELTQLVNDELEAVIDVAEERLEIVLDLDDADYDGLEAAMVEQFYLDDPDAVLLAILDLFSERISDQRDLGNMLVGAQVALGLVSRRLHG